MGNSAIEGHQDAAEVEDRCIAILPRQHEQDGVCTPAKSLLGNAAKEETSKSTPAMGTHDDQI